MSLSFHRHCFLAGDGYVIVIFVVSKPAHKYQEEYTHSIWLSQIAEASYCFWQINNNNEQQLKNGSSQRTMTGFCPHHGQYREIYIYITLLNDIQHVSTVLILNWKYLNVSFKRNEWILKVKNSHLTRPEWLEHSVTSRIVNKKAENMEITYFYHIYLQSP